MKYNFIIITLIGITIFEKIINYLSYNLHTEEMYWEQYCPKYWEIPMLA
jgi:hypothetical protein